jgi:DNA-binding CsgD family transcriptional regulator
MLLAAEAVSEAADLAQRAQTRRAANALRTRAAALAGSCEGAVTPALSLVDQADPLTPREREIATLAADRVASREIAERLFLSVRTVDNHLQRIYTKLGVTGRAELADALGRGRGEERDR